MDQNKTEELFIFEQNGYRVTEQMLAMPDGVRLYTRCILPEQGDTFPVIFTRTPYDPVALPSPFGVPKGWYARSYAPYLSHGYALVHQHCCGTGMSEGEFSAYMRERGDGLATLDWIRSQPFYNGEIYVMGGSYTSFVHLSYLDSADDIKGAALSVEPASMYKGYHEHGVFKKDIHFGWFMDHYHKKSLDTEALNREKRSEAMRLRPVTDVARFVYGEDVPEFTEMMRSEHEEDAYWQAHDYPHVRASMKSMRAPVLLFDGWYDIYINTMFDMWNELPPQTRAQSAMIVGPWNHSMNLHAMTEEEIAKLGLSDGEMEQDAVILRWFEHIRGRGAPLLAEPGRVRYYRIGQGWQTARVVSADAYKTLYLSDDGALCGQPGAETELSYRYDPDDPAYFPGGQDAFNTQPTGLVRQREQNTRPDVLSFVSAPLPDAVTVEGEIEAALTVKSDCEDTAFFIRVSAVKGGDTWVMRDTIFTLDRETGGYTPGSAVQVTVHTAPVSWRLEKGDQIRVDVSSSNFPTYAAHTNTKGNWAEQAEAKIAQNTVLCGKSWLKLPVKE